MSTVADIITGVNARLGGNISITSTTDPSESEVIQWCNETCKWLTHVCARENSELGRTTGSVSATDGTASYNTLASAMMIPHHTGWILKTYERVPVYLCQEMDSLDYDPSYEGEPEKFYVDGSNNVVFLPTPDTSYTVKIPYWAFPTALTTTKSTIPFLGIFDNVIIEAVTMRCQNREEYDLTFEQNWMSFLLKQARELILMRRNPNIAISWGNN